MNKGEIFQTVTEHLIKQNKQSINSHEICLYRNEDGLKCAIGILIKDEDYRTEMEGINVEQLYQCGFLPSYLKDDYLRNVNLLGSLQELHDGVIYDNGVIVSFLNRIKELAVVYNIPKKYWPVEVRAV